MPTLPNPQQVSVVIQAIFDNASGAVSTADNIASALSNITADKAITIASNTGQVVASVVSVAAAVTAGTIVAPSVAIGVSATAAIITISKNVYDNNGAINLGDILNILGNMATVASTGVSGGVIPVAVSIAGATFGAAGIIENRAQGGLGGIVDQVNDAFNAAKNWVLPKDPLILDLDGNGIQTRAIDPAAPILFDHNADGIKTGTGWVGAGDGMVVLDLDGNGSIDSGRELFGDNTVITSGARAGQFAANGFDAIAQYDANADGAIDSSDAIYSQLRIWQDSNADGISQGTELKTLAELGIASIGVAGTADGSSLGGGNTQAQKGSFTRTDGSSGDSASVQLAANNFYREFTDDPALVEAVAALPQMGGSGAVRDLREAMSLGTAQAATLQAKLAEFAAGTTRAAQMSVVDDLISAWGATSAMATSIDVNKTLAQTASRSFQ